MFEGWGVEAALGMKDWMLKTTLWCFCVSSVSSNHCNGNSDVTSNAEVLY